MSLELLLKGCHLGFSEKLGTLLLQLHVLEGKEIWIGKALRPRLEGSITWQSH